MIKKQDKEWNLETIIFFMKSFKCVVISRFLLTTKSNTNFHMRTIKNILLFALLLKVIIVCAQIDGDPDIGDLSAPGVFYDKFELPLDLNVWEIHNRVWGQPTNPTYQHGGVITENCYTENGYAVMRSLGDYYTGPLTGRNGKRTRIGGAMYTKQTFASGRYEVKMKALQRPNMGVLSAPWTFRSETITSADDPFAYNKALSQGANSSGGTVIINSEIDIELKGVNLANPIMKHWLTVERSAGGDTQLPVNLNDGEFHVYRWDWHTGGHGEQARVEYYVDDILYRTITQYVPYMSANMTIGNWFAWWASLDLDGSYKAPLFDTDYVYVDWLKITPFYEAEDDWFRTEGQTAYPNWVAHKIPGNIDAINFDRGGEGISYYDTSFGNTGSGPRQTENVDTTNDDGGEPSIGWGSTGEWQEYTVNVAQTGYYTATVRVSSAIADPGSFRLDIDGVNVSGTIDAITTGSWTSFQDVTINNINLTAGQHILRFNNLASGFNWSKVTFTYSAPVQDPYPNSNIPHAIPGAIVATNFDRGGEGISYYDTSSGNAGSGPRQTENVDTAYDDGGESSIGWGSTGEWQEYTINVAQTGYYTATVRVASAIADSGSFRLDIDGVNVSGTIDAVTTGSWTSFQDVVINNISLTAGQNILRFNNLASGFNWSKFNFTRTSAKFNFDETKVEEVGVESLIYTNPISDRKLNIHINKNNGTQFNLKIVTISGTVSFSIRIKSGKNQIDLPELSAGLYLMDIRNDNGYKKTEKLVIL